MATTPITVRIDTDLLEYLKTRAEKEHRTLSNLIISVLLNDKYNEEHDIMRVFEKLENGI